MYKKIINFTIFSIIIYIFYLSFKNYQVLAASLIDTSIMFIKNVFPFLFITILLNSLLIDLNLPFYFQKIFNNKYIYIFFMSILSGTPTSSIIIEKYLQKNDISEKDASLLLTFTAFNTPLFLYYYLNKIFIDKLIILKIILIIYISNILLFLFYYKKLSKNISQTIKYNRINIMESLINNIKASINSIIYIYATILFFKMTSDLLISPTSIIRGFIEITQGLNALSISNYNLKIKELLTLVILNFGGLSIHIQICNVLKNYNINYKYFYLSRIIYIIFSFIILFI